MLFYFASILAADNKINVNEAKFFKALCAKLGFPDDTAKDALRWTSELVMLQQERRDIEDQLVKLRPVFDTIEAKNIELDLSQLGV